MRSNQIEREIEFSIVQARILKFRFCMRDFQPESSLHATKATISPRVPLQTFPLRVHICDHFLITNISRSICYFLLRNLFIMNVKHWDAGNGEKIHFVFMCWASTPSYNKEIRTRVLLFLGRALNFSFPTGLEFFFCNMYWWNCGTVTVKHCHFVALAACWTFRFDFPSGEFFSEPRLLNIIKAHWSLPRR